MSSSVDDVPDFLASGIPMLCLEVTTYNQYVNKGQVCVHARIIPGEGQVSLMALASAPSRPASLTHSARADQVRGTAEAAFTLRRLAEKRFRYCCLSDY